MNVTESRAVQTVLARIIDDPDVTPSEEDAIEAAAFLAERADDRLGITGTCLTADGVRDKLQALNVRHRARYEAVISAPDVETIAEAVKAELEPFVRLKEAAAALAAALRHVQAGQRWRRLSRESRERLELATRTVEAELAE